MERPETFALLLKWILSTSKCPKRGESADEEWKHGGNIKDCSINESCSLDRTLKISFVSYLTQIDLKGRNYTRFGKTKLPSFELKPEKYEK